MNIQIKKYCRIYLNSIHFANAFLFLNEEVPKMHNKWILNRDSLAIELGYSSNSQELIFNSLEIMLYYLQNWYEKHDFINKF